MSIHNICFIREIRKNVNDSESTSWLDKRILIMSFIKFDNYTTLYMMKLNESLFKLWTGK